MSLSNDAKSQLLYALGRPSAATEISNAINAGSAGYDASSTHTYGTAATLTGLSVVEKGSGAVHKTIITLDEVELTITEVEAASSAADAAFGSQLLYTFPQAHILLLGSHMVFPLGDIVGGTGVAADADLEFGVGTTARVEAANFDLHGTTTDDNIVPVDVATQFVGSSSAAIESSQSTAVLFSDGSASAVKAYLNFISAGNSADVTATGTITVSGTITMVWTALGDD